MITIKKGTAFTIEWSVYKGASDVLEDFSRALLKVFLISPEDKIVISHEVSDGVIVVAVPGDISWDQLVLGAYSIQAVWVKDGATTKSAVWDGSKRCMSVVPEVFALTNNEDEVTNSGSMTLKVKSHVATYGYDGMDAYELCVLLGQWNTSLSEWIKSKLGQLVVTTDITDEAVTTPKIADGAVTKAKLSQDLQNDFWTAEALEMLAKAYTSEKTAEALALLSDYNAKTAQAVADAAEAVTKATEAEAETATAESAATTAKQQATDSATSAELAAQYLAKLLVAIEGLPDAEGVSAQVAENTANIAILQEKDVYCTQAEYDAMVEAGTIDNTKDYNIVDA